VVREGVRGGGRNDPNIVCTYELKKKKERLIPVLIPKDWCSGTGGCRGSGGGVELCVSAAEKQEKEVGSIESPEPGRPLWKYLLGPFLVDGLRKVT
jgi:hypothetical protein